MSPALRTDDLTVVIDVESGARVTQITDARGRDWLVDLWRGNPPVSDSVDFASGTRGGWDECLPSIAACPDPNPERAGTDIPDHGVFWMRPWRVVRLGRSSVEVDSDPTDHPLRVWKKLTLEAGSSTLTTRIRITNLGESDYGFLYSAHPLWNWRSPAVIEAPGSTELRAAFGSGLPDLKSFSTELDPNGTAENYKYFLRWDGLAHLRFPSTGARLSLTGDPRVTPWLGVCINRAAWPSVEDEERWIALEPTNSPTDLLLDAMTDESALTLASRESIEWTSAVKISYD